MTAVTSRLCAEAGPSLPPLDLAPPEHPANLDDWTPSIYGAGDQRGAFNEVTPAKTAAALKLLQRGQGQRASRRSSSAS